MSWRKEDLKQRLEKSRRLARGEQEVELTPSGEEGIRLIRALAGLDRMVSNVNVPNRGQIPNLPLGTVVETNAVFARDSIKPLLAGPLPEQLRALMLPHVEIQDLSLRAALCCDREAVLEALLLDPNTRAKCRDREALARLTEDMLAAAAAYLPEGWGLR